MSIYLEIIHRTNEGRLFPLPPLMPGALGNAPRQIYVTQEVYEICNMAGWQDAQWIERCMRLRADLDRFSQGGVIPIARRPFIGGRRSYMRQLFRWREEVWEIRSQDDPPIRVLGRFADTDIFIALTWHKRADLLGPTSREWRDAINRCKAEWRKLFPVYQPKSSDGSNAYPTDYISNAILV